MKSMMKFIAVAAVAVMAVASFAQGGGGGGRGGQRFGGGFGNDPTGAGLVNRDDVSGEIKITADQKSKIDALRQSQREKMREMFQNGGGGQDPTAFQKMQAENNKAILALLTDDQKKRLKELAIQRMKESAATHADIQKELGVTDDQKAKIKDLQDKQQAANAAIMEKMRNQEIEREAATESFRKNTDALNSEIGQILTDAQKSKLKAMSGKEFKFVEQGRGGG
jgi:Spy/CpxP family protein refolding chaperone